MKFLLLLTFLFASAAFATPRANVTLTSKNTVTLRGEVTYQSVADTFYTAKKLSAELGKKEPLFLVIDSPGGSISAGLELVRNLKSLDRRVHTITVFGASMGFIIGQSLGARLLTEDGVLMSHKASGGFRGEFPGQVDSRYNFWLRIVKRVNENIAKRTKGVHTVESYEKLIENEYWCGGEDCAGQGFVDYIVTARCDESLSGAEEKTANAVIMGFAVSIKGVYDNCPLNSGPLTPATVMVNGLTIFSPDADKVVPFSQIPGVERIIPEIEKIINPDNRINLKR